MACLTGHQTARTDASLRSGRSTLSRTDRHAQDRSDFMINKLVEIDSDGLTTPYDLR